MAQPLVISCGKDMIAKAKRINIEPQWFINLDVNQLAIKYRKMAPIVIARRMKRYISVCIDAASKEELEACISDMEAAHEFNVTTGEFRLIKLGVKQSDGKVGGVMATYRLYRHEGIAVADFVLIDIVEKRSVDYQSILSYGAFGLLTALLIPGLGILEMGAVLATRAAGLTGLAAIKGQTTKENIEALLLKTLEHYGLIRFVDETQIELITD